jgi:predicted transcriptional regulator
VIFRLPTGRQIVAARALLGMQQRELAKLAKLDVTTLVRIEKSGTDPIRGQGASISAVITVLEKRGVEFLSDGVRVNSKRR